VPDVLAQVQAEAKMTIVFSADRISPGVNIA
jgi:hypothetical protein